MAALHKEPPVYALEPCKEIMEHPSQEVLTRHIEQELKRWKQELDGLKSELQEFWQCKWNPEQELKWEQPEQLFMRVRYWEQDVRTILLKREIVWEWRSEQDRPELEQIQELKLERLRELERLWDLEQLREWLLEQERERVQLRVRERIRERERAKEMKWMSQEWKQFQEWVEERELEWKLELGRQKQAGQAQVLQLEREMKREQMLKQQRSLLLDKSQDMKVRQLGQIMMVSKRKEEQLNRKLVGLKWEWTKKQDCERLSEDLERLDQKWRRLQVKSPAKLRLELEQLEQDLRKWKSDEEYLKRELKQFVLKQEWESFEVTQKQDRGIEKQEHLESRMEQLLLCDQPQDKSLQIEQKLRQWIRRRMQLQRVLERMRLVWQFEVLDMEWEGLDWEWGRWVWEQLTRQDVPPQLEQELKQVLKIRKLDEDYLAQQLEGREREQSERKKIEQEPEPQKQMSAPVTVATGKFMESSNEKPETRESLASERNVLIPLEDPTVQMLPDDPESLIDPVEVILCDEKGGIYHNPTHGVTIQIPSGAIPAGMKVKISIGVLLQGNFDFPADLSPVSIIVWLCTAKPDFVFSRQIKVFIPHCMECKSNVEAARLQMLFMKASHFSSSANSFKFSPADGVQDFGTVTSKGILHTRHLCYNCIVAGTRSKELRSKKFCVTCAEPVPYVSGPLALFFITYDLDNCRELIRSKLPVGYKIMSDKERLFRFQSPSDGISRDFRCSKGLKHMVALEPGRISKESVDFCKLYRRKELKSLQDRGHYPPRMTLQVAELPSKAEFIKVTFKGTQILEEEMTVAIRVPSKCTSFQLVPRFERENFMAMSSFTTDCRDVGTPVRMGMTRFRREDMMSLSRFDTYCRDKATPVLMGTPTVKQLLVMRCSKEKSPVRLVQEIAPKWELLGYALDFDAKGSHVKLIKSDCTIEGSVACCYRVLMDWLDGRGACQPPTWAKLIEILSDIGEIRLAQEIIDLISH